MLLFGHIGTTLGAAIVLERLCLKTDKTVMEVPVDYRLVMFGSMLPDIIDKPLVLMLSDKPVGSARFLAHSLIFIVVLLILGELFGLAFKRNRFLLVGYAGFAHLIEDLIWRTPKVLFWPYYNWVLGSVKKSQPTMGRVDIEKRISIITTSISKLDM